MTDADRRLGEWFPRSGVGPLSDVLVCDLSRVLAGPYCTMLLADLGATVIKVESPQGDETRTWSPPDHQGVATYFLSINRNKHSIALDLADEADREVALQIAARADVLVENFKPGGAARFGLDHATVAAINPGIVYASITGFGAGAGAALPGYDLLVQAVSGMMDLTGDPSGPPLRTGVAVVDVMTGLHAAMGILAALHHRVMTGEGQRLELSLLTSALSGLVNQSGAAVLTGRGATRMGNAHPSVYPYEPFDTGDGGQIVLAVGNDRQFGRLCDAVGLEGVDADPRFATNADRSHHRAELRALLTDALASRDAATWHGLLTEARVPCGPILDVTGGIRLAQDLGLTPIATAGTGPSAVPGIRNPVAMSATPPTYDLPPPPVDGSGRTVREWLEATRPRS